MTSSQHPDMQDLQKAFDFTDEDLQANQKGHLSEKQIQSLNQTKNENIWLLGLLWIFMILLIYLYNNTYGSISGICLMILGIWLPATIFLTWYLLSEREKMGDVIRQNRLSIHEGTAVLNFVDIGWTSVRGVKARSHMPAKCYVTLNNEKFEITIPQLEALRNERTYRIYYFPLRKIILSIEPLF